MRDLETLIGQYAVVTSYEGDVFGAGWATRVVLNGLPIAGDRELRDYDDAAIAHHRSVAAVRRWVAAKKRFGTDVTGR